MIDIKDRNGNKILSVGLNIGCKRKFSLMKEDYVTLKFSTAQPVAIGVGTYVETRYGRFEICDEQRPTFNTSTGGYDYDLRFDATYWKWKNKIFKYTPERGGREAAWNLTATLDVQLGVFLRNLKALGYRFNGVDYTFSIDGTVENKAVEMNYDNTSLLDALFSMAAADKWNCDCWITENVIHFGRCEFGEEVELRQGVNAAIGGNDSKGVYATRIYPFGGSRNIPQNYRPISEGVVINGIVRKRVMLPEGVSYIDAYRYVGGKRVYIGDPAYGEGIEMPIEEAIEEVVVFDDVYPKTDGVVSNVTTKEYTDKIENQDGTTTLKKWNAYRYRDASISFSEKYILPGQELTICFQSGKLNGMVFGVTFNPDGKPERLPSGEINKDAQIWEIVRNETYGRPLPDDTLFPANEDRFILAGFDTLLVNDELVFEAEKRLKTEAEKYAGKAVTNDSVFTATVYPSWVVENEIERTFGVGQRIRLVAEELFGTYRSSRVIGYEFCLDIPYDHPIYTVGESAAYSRISDIEEKIESLTYKGQTYVGGGGGVYVIRTNDNTPPSNSNVFSALKSLATFLRKDADDTAKGAVTFLKEIGSLASPDGKDWRIGADGVSKFRSVAAREKVDTDLLRLGEFLHNVSGGFIDRNGDGELNSLYLRSSLKVPEIRFNRMTYFDGCNIISPGGGVLVESVSEQENGSFVITAEREKNDPMGLFVDDILTGFWYNFDEPGLKGFDKVQYRVTSVDYEKKTAVVMPNPQTASVKIAPHMRLAQTGNFTNEERQTFIMIEARDGNCCMTLFDGVNTWDWEAGQQKSWFGKKKGGTVGPYDADGFDGVLRNMYISGMIHQVDSVTNEEIRVPIDKGDWKPGKHGYYDRVSHDGALWLCVNKQGTTSEPADGNPDWLKQVDKGESPYIVQVTSKRGVFFQGGNVSTTLTATVYKSDIDVTDNILPDAFSWTRSSTDSEDDLNWNKRHEGCGRSVEISGEDVNRSAVFECVVNI